MGRRPDQTASGICQWHKMVFNYFGTRSSGVLHHRSPSEFPVDLGDGKVWQLCQWHDTFLLHHPGYFAGKVKVK